MTGQQTTTERGRKPKDIPSVDNGEFADTNDENTFKWLSEEYHSNDYNDTLIEALNTLPDDERNLMILYITHKNKLAPLARYFHVSTPFIRRRISEIREKIISVYEELLNGQERVDYKIYRLRQQQEEQRNAKKRPLVQMPLYDTDVIAEYDSVDDAAKAVNGSPDRIRGVCNGSNFKYLNFRWLWKDDYENKYINKKTRGWYMSKCFS